MWKHNQLFVTLFSSNQIIPKPLKYDKNAFLLLYMNSHDQLKLFLKEKKKYYQQT